MAVWSDHSDQYCAKKWDQSKPTEIGSNLFISACKFTLYLFYSVRGYATPLLKGLINNNCDSSTRATVLSIRNLFVRFGFALLGPSIGWMSNNFSLSSGLVLAGAILLLLSLVTGLWLYKYVPESFEKY